MDAIERRTFLTRAAGLAAVSVKAGTALAQSALTQTANAPTAHMQTRVARTSGVRSRARADAICSQLRRLALSQPPVPNRSTRSALSNWS